MATLFEPFDPGAVGTKATSWIDALSPAQGFVEHAILVEEHQRTSDPLDEEHEAQTNAHFEAGRQTGLAEARAEFAAESVAHGKLSSQIKLLDRAMSKALQTRLADLVSAICEEVLGQKAFDPSSLQVRCERAAKVLSLPLDRITIYLHPQDISLLDPSFTAAWNLAEDSNCERGTIRLEAGEQIIRDGPQDWQRAIAEAIRT